MTFNIRQTFGERAVRFTLVTIFFILASSLNAKQDKQEVLFSNCDITISDLERKTGILCSNQAGGIKFEIQGDNRSNSGLMGDMTPVFNNFWRERDHLPEYTISLTPYRYAPNVWRVHYLGEDGEELSSTFNYFVWSRNFSVPGVGRNDLAISYSPTRTIKCFKEADNPNMFRGCITYYTALVCDTWHNRNSHPVTVVNYPTIAVRTESYESSISMMRNFEVIQRIAEKLLNQTRKLSCEN
jgi:hypothetical protein